MRSQTGGAAPDTGFTAFRPRLRHDALFADNGDGALLQHPEGRFLIKGAGAYGLVRAIAPYLDGSATVGELCADLPEAQRASVVGVLRSLADRGFVRDFRPGPATELPEAVLRRFADQIGYIEHYTDGAEARFARFRGARVLLAGSGAIDRAIAVALLRNGIAAVHVPAAGPDDPAWAGAEAEAAGLRAADCPAEVRTVAPATLAGALGGGPSAPAAGTDGADAAPGAEGPAAAWDAVVVTPGEGRPAALWRHLSEHPGGAAAPLLLPVAVVGGHAVAGPMTRPGRGPCWCCAVLRLGTGAGPETAAALWRELALPAVPAAAAPLDPHVARMLGTMVAFELFRDRTGALPADTDGAAVLQDLTTLESAREPVLAHPLCPRCGVPGAGADAPDAGEAPGAPVIGRDTAPADGDGAAATDPDPSQEGPAADHGALFGPRLGVFSGYADAALAQSPLKAGAVRMPLPVRSGARVITAFDTATPAAARVRAVGAAAICYTDEAVRTRAAVAARTHAAPPADAVRVAPERLATWSGLPADTGGRYWFPAAAMAAGGVRWVDAAAVLPFSACNDDAVFERSAAGAGCGPDPARAAAEGLLSALGHDALRAALHGTARVRELPAASLGTADETVFLLRTAENLGCAPLLLDLDAASPAHTVLAIDPAGGGPPLWTQGVGLDRGGAAAAALRDLLGIRQLADTADAAPADPGDPLLPGLDPRTLLAAADGPAPARPATDHPALLADLRERGREAYAADLTPVDLAACGLHTVRVVLTR